MKRGGSTLPLISSNWVEHCGVGEAGAEASDDVEHEGMMCLIGESAGEAGDGDEVEGGAWEEVESEASRSRKSEISAEVR